MAASSFATATSDLTLPSGFDIFVKNVATRVSSTVQGLRFIGYVDTTKFGILQQPDIDKIAQWAEKLIAKNALGCLF